MAYASYKWSKESKRDELRNVGLDLIGLGVRLMPLGGNLKKGEEKKPLYRFLPRNPDNENKASWKMLASQGPTTPQMIDAWLAGGACGFAALTGHLYSNSLYIFDFDVDGYFDKWIANPKVNAILRDSKAFVQKTGGGGYQVFLFLEEETPANKQYAWHPCDNEQGRVIAIESRGRGGYAVGPRSAHPSGNEYKPLDMFGGTLKEMTRITSDDFKILEDVAMSLCKVPKSKKQIEREKRNQERERERATRAASKPRYASSDHGDVIGRFNHDNDIETILLQNGYSRGVGGRLSRPDAPKNSGSGVVLYHGDNKSFHYSSNDELSDGHAKTPFDVILHFEFDGDMTRAIKEIASSYGVDHASTRQASRRSKDYFDVRHALPSVVTSDVPSWLANAPLAHELAPTPSTHAQHPRANTHAQSSATFIPPPPPPPTEDYPIDDYQTIDYDQLLIDCAVMAPAQLSADHDQPMPEQKKFSWPQFKANQFIELRDDQYVSDVFDFNSLIMGQVWGLQSGTGTGKTTAADMQLNNFVMAVPLVGQVKQFVTRFKGDGLYEGQRFDLNSRKIFTTYDSLSRLVKAHKKGDINLKEKTAIIDEAHHIALDGFKDTEVFNQLIEFVGLCGRAIFMTGTMPPLSVLKFDHKVEITRKKPEKPLKTVLTKDLANFIIKTRDDHKFDNHKLLQDIHLNNKKSIAAYVDELLGLDPNLKIIVFSKETEENEEPHHMRVLYGDGCIDSDVDIIFRTSIIDDGIDIFTDRKVISLVVSNVTPLTIEQAGARFRNSLPVMTYVVRMSETPKEKAEKKRAKGEDVEAVDEFFHMQKYYEKRVEEAEARIPHLKALLKIEMISKNLKDRASAAQKVMWGNLLSEHVISGNKIVINKVKILQAVTKEWGYFCKRNDDALNEALSPYGYKYVQFEIAKTGKGITARDERRKEVKTTKKEIENEKIKNAVKAFDTMTDVEVITTRCGNKKQRSETHKAATVMTTMYNAGLTFEASKLVIEDLSGFHGRTVGNVERQALTSLFYHEVKAGKVSQEPSAKALERLFLWLKAHKEKSDKLKDEEFTGNKPKDGEFTADEWAQELLFACHAACDEIAHENFFGRSAKAKTLQDRRGNLLSDIASIEKRAVKTGNRKVVTLFRVKSVPHFSDSSFRNGLTVVGSLGLVISKKYVIKEKRDVLLITDSEKEAKKQTEEAEKAKKQAEQAKMKMGASDKKDVVSKQKSSDEEIREEIAMILHTGDDVDYDKASSLANDISDFATMKRTTRYIACLRKNNQK